MRRFSVSARSGAGIHGNRRLRLQCRSGRRTGGVHGLRVSARLQHGPLWRLSARALRLWIYLAMKADHTPQTMSLSDGQRVPVARGQWLTSTRKLRKEIGGSIRKITEDLDELRSAGAINVRPIPRTPKGNGDVSRLSTSNCVMASLLTIEGLTFSADPVPRMSTKEEIRRTAATSSPRLSTEEREWLNAERILSAEGR